MHFYTHSMRKIPYHIFFKEFYYEKGILFSLLYFAIWKYETRLLNLLFRATCIDSVLPRDFVCLFSIVFCTIRRDISILCCAYIKLLIYYCTHYICTWILVQCHFLCTHHFHKYTGTFFIGSDVFVSKYRCISQ